MKIGIAILSTIIVMILLFITIDKKYPPKPKIIYQTKNEVVYYEHEFVVTEIMGPMIFVQELVKDSTHTYLDSTKKCFFSHSRDFVPNMYDKVIVKLTLKE